MKKRILHIVTVIIAATLLVSCGGRGGSSAHQPEIKFRSLSLSKGPQVPSMITDRTEASEYIVTHFWDNFLDGGYTCDSTHVNGVSADEVESAIGMYVTLLEDNCSRSFAGKTIEEFFKKVERFTKDHPGTNVYGFFEKMIPKYLYDPNSPVRDEDLYLPYVSGLASSDMTDEDKKAAYSFDREMCSLNPVGSVASDFTFTDLSGKRYSLHGIKAEHTLLMFTNPGCQTCKETINSLVSNATVRRLVESGDLAVANIYIDLEREKWLALAREYPSAWYNGYDQDYAIRQNRNYNVRGIPSLYVLDADKKVLLKDAPVEKVMSVLLNIQK